MVNLEKLRIRAQNDANRENVTLMILNLNPMGFQYVIRFIDGIENPEKLRGFVELIKPQK